MGRIALVVVVLAGAGLVGSGQASSSYDGVYRGEATRTRGDDTQCGTARYPVTYTVVNGQFSIVYDPTRHVGVNLQIQPDGTFSGSQSYIIGRQTAMVKASGRIAGNVMEAQVEGYACARSYRLTKG